MAVRARGAWSGGRVLTAPHVTASPHVDIAARALPPTSSALDLRLQVCARVPHRRRRPPPNLDEADGNEGAKDDVGKPRG